MSEEKRMLEGIRVVEAASIIMAPSAGTILSDFGADVTKIEQPTGDLLRMISLLSGMPKSDIQYCYLQLNRNKKGIVIDLKQSEGMEALHRLLERADVFISNFRPNVLERLGLTYDDLRERYPRLVYAYATGFGEKGAERNRPGYDVITYWCRSGIEGSLFPYEGWLGGVPPGSGDHPSGMALVAGIMMALYKRERTGKGEKVSTSLLANGAWANACLIQAELCNAEFQEKQPRSDTYNFIGLHYRTSDDRMLKLSIANIERDWPAFCGAIDCPELEKDERFANSTIRENHMRELISIIDDRFESHDFEYWRARLTEYDIPHAALPTYAEIAADEQMAVNDVFVEYDHPRYGKMRSVNSPINIEGENKVPPKPAPEIGEHTREVLASVGYATSEIDAMIEKGAAFQYPS